LIGWNDTPNGCTFEEEVKIWVEKENITFVKVSTKADALPPMLQFCKSLITSRFCYSCESPAIPSPILPYILLGDEEPKSLLDSVKIAYEKHTKYGAVPTDVIDTINICLSQRISNEQTAIRLYTHESRLVDKSLYKLLNMDLINQQEDRNFTKNWKYYLYYLFKGLKEIPCESVKTVYRGVPKNVTKEYPERYEVGNTVIWYTFTSTSIIQKTADEFIKNQPASTLFIIHNVTAWSLKSLSEFSKEEEYLLPPTTTFKIKKITSPIFSKMVIIEMEQIPAIERGLYDFLNNKE